MTPSGFGSGYPSVGDVVDSKYRVEELIGQGGMGAVARATHLVRRAPVALKFMSVDVVLVPGAVERFINEAVAASQIDSDHIVRIFDTGTLPNGAPYLVMELLVGVDLSQLIAREGPGGLAVPRAVHLVLQILRALQIAHAAGIIHRDMKPANCFVVVKDGEPDFVKLLDFGISKVRSPDGVAITHENAALGTPLYMSPEQARSPRDVDSRSDLYATGVILYELLTGVTPVTSPSGDLGELLYKLFTSEAPPIKTHRPDLPDGLAAAVHQALVHDLAARVPTAAAMAESLAPWADERSAAVLSRIRANPARGVASAPPPVVLAAAVSATLARDAAIAATQPSDAAPAQSAVPPKPPPGYLGNTPKRPGGQTDLGSSKENSDETTPPGGARGSRLAAGLGALAAVLVAGVAAFVLLGHEPYTPSSSSPSALPPSTPSVIWAPLTTASGPVLSAPSASGPSLPPSADPSAQRAPLAPSPKTVDAGPGARPHPRLDKPEQIQPLP